MKFSNIKAKLIATLLALSIIPLLLTTSLVFFETEKGFSFLIEDQQEKMIQNVQSELKNVSENLLKVTNNYSQNEQLIKSFQSGSREQLLTEVNQIYPRLQEEHGLSVFEFGDKNGTVILRGHNPSKFGDDKSDVQAIQYALKGQSISGFEVGQSGLSIRAFAPIKVNDEIIGTLQTSIESSFLEQLTNQLTGVTINLYDQEGTTIYSSEPSNINSILEADTLSKVLKGETSAIQNSDTIETILPMYDPTESEIIGGIGIHQNISFMNQVQNQILIVASIIVIFTILVVIIIAIFFSRSISKPIVHLAKTMDELSEGNLKVETQESNRKDEIGHLLNATHVMKNTLYTTLQKVSNSSQLVAKQSTDLKESAYEINAGSQQISYTMTEISSGSENQASNISNLTSNAIDFSTSIQETSNKGYEINRTTNEVLLLTNKGKELMLSSDTQMTRIDQVMKQAVQKMQSLELHSKEISKLVLIIEEIANQTNLLSLNAAIEAARAGEHGKGFAVVADEVRKLAEQVSISVTDITKIVSNIQMETDLVKSSLKEGYNEIQQGSAQIHTTGETFNKISLSVTDMVEEISTITQYLEDNVKRTHHMRDFLKEIASTSEETAAAVEQTAATTEEFNSSIEEISNSTDQLAQLADELKDLVHHFKL